MDKFLYDQFYQLETVHWWFVAYIEIILDQIKRIIHSNKDINILDIGCNTGIMFEYLKEFGTIQGLDFSEEAVHYSVFRLGDRASTFHR